jgi:hypothetical protein
LCYALCKILMEGQFVTDVATQFDLPIQVIRMQFLIDLNSGRMKSVLQYDRYREVYDAVDSAITEMDHLADDLRTVSREHGVRVVNGRYVHLAGMTRACGKMDIVAEKLENAAKTLRNVLSEASPPHEVQDEMISWSLDDPGWVWGLRLLCW